ncbi:hypothetical protein VCR14J2_610159 [Vibrio coralliirubri]|nr:hypothetical protein VCR14J2_610159 [Vibrio coralliirubri]
MSDYSYFCGIDLAKNHFSLHAVDPNGKVILTHKSVTRSKLQISIANIHSLVSLQSHAKVVATKVCTRSKVLERKYASVIYGNDVSHAM